MRKQDLTRRTIRAGLARVRDEIATAQRRGLTLPRACETATNSGAVRGVAR
jgi:hypothetical protein